MEKKELSLSPNLSLSMAVRRLEDKAEKMARLRGRSDHARGNGCPSAQVFSQDPFNWFVYHCVG